MLKVVMILLLCGTGGWAVAQNDDDQKDQSEEQTRRPSWSSGLPERQKPETMSRPDLSEDFQDDLTIDRSELGLERPEIGMPDPEMDPAPISQEEPVSDTEIKDEPAAATESVPTEEPVVEEQPAVTDPMPEPEPVSEPEPEPEPEPVIEPAVYEWLVVEQAEVDFPSRGIRNQISGWVDVEVTLNPQGDVVSAQTVNYSDDAGIYVEAAEESLKKWIFQPPREQGVNELVSKVYRIDFEPPEIEQPVSTQTSTVQNDTTAENTADAGSVADQNSEYQWQILSQAALEYPIAAARKRVEGGVDIMVTINPDGEVVNLEEERYSSRGRVFVEPAKASLLQWQFSPPKNQGINSNVSRSYRIEFEL